MDVKNLVAIVDSRLVVNQINGSYEAKEQSMTQYLEKANALIDNFKMFSIEQVPRSENKKADALSKITSTSFAHLTKQVLVEILKRKSIEEREILVVVEEEGYCWITPLIEYLAEGPFPEAQGKVKFLIVAIDNFTKWIEEKPVAMITGNQVKKFVEEVPHVLWAHRTIIKTSNGDTSFSLTYDTKAVIPVEIGVPSLRCAEINQAENDEGLLLNLDILEEIREKAAIREAKSKSKMEKYYNAKVRSMAFRPGDFVYRSNEASNAKESGKLGPKWEGPYEVVEALGKGAYKLRNGSGDILPRTWNVKDLKKCYL
ncbi:reverse transcriptase domain-containing protein [Tanacetum coccineum]